MAQTVAVVRNTLTATGGGTTDFTKTGFGTPTAAIIIICEANTTSNPQANAALSIGFWDGTNQRAVGISCIDTVEDADTLRISDDSYGAVVAHAILDNSSNYSVSAITDGIRLTLSVDNTSLQRFATVILLAGVSATVGTFTPNATQNGTQASASLGYAPQLVFFICVGATTADVATGSAILSFGFAAAGTQRMIAFSSTSAAAAEQATLLLSESRCVGQVFADATIWTGEVTTFGADTFTMTTRDGASGSDVCFFLALGGADLSFDCGTLTTPTSTGVDAVATDVEPDAILLALSTAPSTILQTGSGANGLMIGMADANGQFCHNQSVEDGAATTNCNSAAQAAAVLDLDSSSGGTRTDMIDATLDSFDADSFNLNYSVVNATARKGFWIAFGEEPAGGTTILPQMMQHHRLYAGSVA